VEGAVEVVGFATVDFASVEDFAVAGCALASMPVVFGSVLVAACFGTVCSAGLEATVAVGFSAAAVALAVGSAEAVTDAFVSL